MDREPAEVCLPETVSFKAMLSGAETEEEQTSSLATVLEIMRKRWDGCFTASDAASFMGEDDERAVSFKAALELASQKGLPFVTSTAVCWRLKALRGAPVQVNGKVLTLHYIADNSGHGGTFEVKEKCP